MGFATALIVEAAFAALAPVPIIGSIDAASKAKSPANFQPEPLTPVSLFVENLANEEAIPVAAPAIFP